MFLNQQTSYTALGLVLALTAATSAGAQGVPKVERTFDDGSSFRFYGQVNKGFLNYDDGEKTKTYDLIDNDNSSTRFGFDYARGLGADWGMATKFEMEYQPFNTFQANINEDVPDGGYDFTLDNNLRHADFIFTNERIGTFWLGQGSMASDGSAESDLSGTGLIGYSSIADSAGGQIIRQTDGDLSDFTVGNAFTNYDGLGRKMRVRYDTRGYKGFTAKASYGQNVLGNNSDDLYDAALHYGNEYETFEVAAAAAYSWQGSDTTIVSGSGSVLHKTTGLNFTLAGGQQDNGDKKGSYGYAKLGWLADFLSVGTSAFGVDMYKGDDITIEKSDSESVGLSVVQKFERYNTEFWLTYREYKYGDNNNDYYKGKAAFTGLRFKW